MNSLFVSIRAILRRPRATLLAALILAAGSATSIALFSVIDSLLLDEPYPSPEGLVLVSAQDRDGGRRAMFPLDVLEVVRSHSEIFSHVSGYGLGRLVRTGRGGAEYLDVEYVDGEMFELLGTGPQLGRAFTSAEAGAALPLVVLSHAYWESHFAGDPAAIGATLTLNGQDHTIIGVMPPGYSGPRLLSRMDAWLPRGRDPDSRTGVMIFARLGPAVTLAQAQAALGRRLGLEPLEERWYGETRQFLTGLLGAVGLLMAIATANAALLQVAAARSRGREVSLRLALGATARRVHGSFIVEGLCTGLLAALAGWLGALWLTDAIRGVMPAFVPRAGAIEVRAGALVAGAALSIAFGALAAWLPGRALTSSADLARDLRQSHGAVGDRPLIRAVRVLITAEVALTAVLLVGAGLMVRSYASLTPRDPGFAVADRLAARLVLAEFTADSRRELVQALTQSARHLPGVGEAAAISQLPLTGISDYVPLTVPGTDFERQPMIHRRVVTPGYLDLMGIPVVSGRTISSGDGVGQPAVALLNEEAARRYFPDVDPLGRVIEVQGESGAGEYHVVGVVGNTRFMGVSRRPVPEVYTAWSQEPSATVHIVVSLEREPGATGEELREMLAARVPSLPVEMIALEELAHRSVDLPRLGMLVVVLFGAFALALAAGGLFATVNWVQARRRREFGIRMALGDTPAGLIRLASADGVRIGLAGLLAGLLGAYWATKLLEPWLFGWRSSDPASFAAGAAVALVTVLIASVAGAVAAGRVNPVELMRSE